MIQLSYTSSIFYPSLPQPILPAFQTKFSFKKPGLAFAATLTQSTGYYLGTKLYPIIAHSRQINPSFSASPVFPHTPYITPHLSSHTPDAIFSFLAQKCARKQLIPTPPQTAIANTSRSSAAPGRKCGRVDYRVVKGGRWLRGMRGLREGVGELIVGCKGGGVGESK